MAQLKISQSKFSQAIALSLGVLAMVFLISIVVLAWTEPSQAPPGANVPAPINVGPTAQTKAGALTIAGGGGDALILKNGGDLRLYNAANSGSALLYCDNNGEIITPGNLTVGGTGGNVCHTVGGTWYSCPPSIDLHGWSFANDYLYDDGEEVIRASDEWLRLNQAGHFASGVYSPGLIRADGGFQVDGYEMVGSNADKLYANRKNTSGGGIWISDDGGFYDYNNAYIDFRGSTGIRVLESDGSWGDNSIRATYLCMQNDCRSSWPSGGDITGVYAGTNLTGGGSSGEVTLNTVMDPTFNNVYVNDWFRNNQAGEGLYNQATGRHWYSVDSNYWDSSAPYGIRIRNGYQGTVRGYLYADGTNVGLLPPDGSWQVRAWNGGVELYDTTYMNSAQAYIFYDRNNTGYYVDPASTSKFNCINLGGVTNCSWPSAGITGSGTTNHIPKWTGSTSLGNSEIYQSGSNIGIGTTSPGVKLDVVNGDIRISGGRSIFSTGRMHIQASENLYLNPWAGASTVYVGGGGGPGDLYVVGRLATMGKSLGCPNGWGCGVHTWDVYADASIRTHYLCLGGGVGTSNTGDCRSSWPGGGISRCRICLWVENAGTGKTSTVCTDFVGAGQSDWSSETAGGAWVDTAKVYIECQ